MSGQPTKTSSGLPDVLTERAVRRLQQQLESQDREYRIQFKGVSDRVGGYIDVTIQVQDKQGNDLAGEYMCRAWIATSPTGARIGTADALDAFAVGASSGAVRLYNPETGTGKEVQVVTDVNGRAVLQLADATHWGLFLRVYVTGRVFTQILSF